jgi:hypothetical protein
MLRPQARANLGKGVRMLEMFHNQEFSDPARKKVPENPLADQHDAEAGGKADAPRLARATRPPA